MMTFKLLDNGTQRLDLNSINQTKKNLIDEDPSVEKDYPPYIINKCMSGHIDCIMFANEMNKNHFIDKKLQYDFFINIVRTKRRFSPGYERIKLMTLTLLKNIMVIVMKKHPRNFENFIKRANCIYQI